MTKKIIAASILSADFANLGKDTEAVLSAGADTVHFDVMDHHFVPNLSFGAIPCNALRKFGITAEIDVHLMVDSPENYIEPFEKAGASRLTFHPETVDNPEAVIKKIRDAGMEAGLAFNPDKPVTISDELLCSLDFILIMSVFPGFGGQSFIEDTLDKIKETRARLDKYKAKTYLAVDGGIKVDNIGKVAQAGANYFVVGSGLFAADDYVERVVALRQALA
ncbi:MAG: ribulose-phosphate 3-epimerase [Coxiellaceae bacterium]|nr:ribulose-phosphate 3-epimerase [Coxiellaceae bacterium]